MDGQTRKNGREIRMKLLIRRFVRVLFFFVDEKLGKQRTMGIMSER